MKKLVPLLLLAVMFTAGCVPGGPTIISTQPPVINSFDASPLSITAGESSTLTWSVSGATKISIEPDVGSVALTGRRMVSPSTTTMYTLTAANASGTVTATAQVVVAGVPTPPPPVGLPVINSFVASPTSITVGGSSILSWNVSNATSVSITGVGAVALVGTMPVVPAVTTTYILTAANAAGSITATAKVTVSGTPAPPVGLPVINFFTASPPVISGSSGSTLLRWDVSDATAVSIAPGIGSVASSGTMLVTLSSSTDYVLTASNAYGWSSRTITVLVTGAPPTPSVFYDFVDNAMSAAWKNGAFADLGFGIVQNDGFARYRTNQMLDDGNIYPRVLETHPQWVSNGSIHGMYPIMTVPAGAKFVAKVGFLAGATGTDGVLFRLTWRESGSPVTVSLGGKSVTYGGSLDSFEVDLSPYAGKTGNFGLKVEAGASSGQDWAAWVTAMIIR